jgi:protein SCO1/2
MKQRRRLAFALAFLLASCGDGTRRFDATGTVEEVQREERQLVIAHDDIPGLMPAMTMNFDVADPALLEGLQPGQRIRFELEHDGRRFRVLSAEPLAEGPAGASGPGRGPRIADLAAAADPAPPFALTDQDGGAVSLEGLRGKTLLLDFVYTSCPGPCPILTGLHVRTLAALPEPVRERVWFVSVSLDPERDTPARMRAYAEARGADLSRWSFLTGDPAAVEAVTKGFGVAKRPGEDGEIDHIVASFLIDGRGQIVKRYLGLEHEAEAIARDLAAIASPGA